MPKKNVIEIKSSLKIININNQNIRTHSGQKFCWSQTRSAWYGPIRLRSTQSWPLGIKISSILTNHKSTWSVLRPVPGPEPRDTTNLPIGTMFCLDSLKFFISSLSLSRMARDGATLEWLDLVWSPRKWSCFSLRHREKTT